MNVVAPGQLRGFERHVRPATSTHRHRRDRFYVVMSATLLLVVVVGFTPTLYLRPGVRRPRRSVLLARAGAVMTAWFVLFLAQAMPVAVRRTDVHRKLGFVGAGLGVAVLVTSLMVTVHLVPRLAETRGIDGAVAGASSIVWANAAALLCFAVFLSSAIALRRRAEVHKRLMLLAAISVVQPAIARISRWTMFDSIENALFSLMVLSVLILPLLVHDFVSRRRIHPVTIVGGGLFLGMRAVAIYGIAASDFGRSVVRSLT